MNQKASFLIAPYLEIKALCSELTECQGANLWDPESRLVMLTTELLFYPTVDQQPNQPSFFNLSLSILSFDSVILIIISFCLCVSFLFKIYIFSS